MYAQPSGKTNETRPDELMKPGRGLTPLAGVQAVTRATLYRWRLTALGEPESGGTWRPVIKRSCGVPAMSRSPMSVGAMPRRYFTKCGLATDGQRPDRPRARASRNSVTV